MSLFASRGRLAADLAIALVALIWGATFVVVKEALLDISTFLFLALRFSFAAALMALVLAPRLGRREPTSWRGGLLCGFFLFLGYALQTAGLRLTSASKSAFITGLYVVLIPLFSSFVHQIRPRAVEWAGAAMATLGTALMSCENLALQLNAGDLLTVGCAVAYSVHILAVAHYSRKMGFERLSLLQVASVALFSWLSALSLEKPQLRPSARVWFALGVTAALATALSFVLYTWAQRRTSATRAALIFALEPVFAGLTAWLVAGERWSAAGLSGAALILGGIVIVEMKPAPAVGHPLE